MSLANIASKGLRVCVNGHIRSSVARTAVYSFDAEKATRICIAAPSVSHDLCRPFHITKENWNARKLKTRISEEFEEEENTILNTTSEDPSNMDLYEISDSTRQVLQQKGITKFFPIQYSTYDLIYNGSDMIARARTGTGKTIAFALPIVEKLKASKHNKTSRHPSVLIMAPTRELAKQVANEIESIAPVLTTACYYGGVGYERQSRSNVDIVVGTPGRIQDLIDRGDLNLSEVKYAVLDEVDQMLQVGFQDAVESILDYIPKEGRQVLFFSATIPNWLNKIARAHLKPNYELVDLIGSEVVKTSETINHFSIMCSREDLKKSLADVVKVYGGDGNTLIFSPTKSLATELSTSSSLAGSTHALHGDIDQAQREITLEAFKNGKFKVLIATDVAARGIDIQNIDLVINLDPPSATESYIHRVGRTGRAGRSGTAITFFNRGTSYLISQIENEAGIKIKRIGLPTLNDILKSSIKEAATKLKKVEESMITHFIPTATEVAADFGGDTTKALAAAIAHITGHASSMNVKSLLCGIGGYTTVTIYGDNLRQYHVLSYLSSVSSKNLVVKQAIGGNFVADIPNEDMKKLTLGDCDVQVLESKIVKVELTNELPELIDPIDHRDRGRYERNERGSDRGDRGNRGGRGGYRGDRERSDRSFGRSDRGGFDKYKSGDRNFSRSRNNNNDRGFKGYGSRSTGSFNFGQE